MSLTIKAGAFYRTRDGRKAFVMHIGHPFDDKCAFPAFGFIDGNGEVDFWTPTGSFEGEPFKSPRDLVSEWRELIKGEAWVVFGESSDFWQSVVTRKDLIRPGEKAVRIRYEEVADGD